MGVRLPAFVGSSLPPRIRNSGRPEIEDALEIYGDAMAQLARRVEQSVPIGDMASYARVVVANTFNAWLRTQHPSRWQVHLRIHHILSGRTPVGGLTMWSVPGRPGRLCGYAVWRDQGRRDRTAQLLSDSLGKPWRERFIRRWLQGQDPADLELGQLMAAVFDSVGGPVEIESLTSAVVRLRQTAEPRRITGGPPAGEDGAAGISPDDFADPAALDSAARAEDRDALAWAWAEIAQLPLNQRLALLLPLDPALLRTLQSWVLGPLERLIETTAEEARDLLRRMPFSDSGIAQRLGVSRQQVANLRLSARRRLARRRSINAARDDAPA